MDEATTVELVESLIATRRSILPKRLFEPGPSEHELDLIFRAAAAAPDHGLLHPWRFVVCPSSRRADLAEVFAQSLIERDSQATERQIEDARAKAFRSPFLMLVVVNLRGLDLAIPASERIVSAGCAIQNVLLMAHAMGYGAGPTSGQAMYASHVRSFFKLSSEEEPLCFISIGTPERSKAGQPRMVPADFVKSL